ncbi:hypothetical protein [Paenarthrobacter nitroguajacolicus]|uniref:hypothetical protein n=1 Tax=Paenarthrobacter nitroguajacolicus TaxID=211146 RepID=UPI00248C10CC|nr:hypothetical protein [Paenarthrobacter nitroguajacolicus]
MAGISLGAARGVAPADHLPPWAVPPTLVVDKDGNGKVAARVLDCWRLPTLY